ncbi:hypothetical protein VZC37_09905 [Gordonia sp. LSe1-13]|uniref:Uncharacterized protein n=1 Tax=Gordonia sesuvii TaxID=3116777 RepID=A0ABU7MC21_9ACTN|nr:hypothetical protein [Gordonia sp. LSe1-13]
MEVAPVQRVAVGRPLATSRSRTTLASETSGAPVSFATMFGASHVDAVAEPASAGIGSATVRPQKHSMPVAAPVQRLPLPVQIPSPVRDALGSSSVPDLLSTHVGHVRDRVTEALPREAVDKVSAVADSMPGLRDSVTGAAAQAIDSGRNHLAAVVDGVNPTRDGAAPHHGSMDAGDLEELARRLYEPLSARLRTELWLDRERSGMLTDR